MNKTVSINISGIVFNIDEDAYQKLSLYLNTIRGYFSQSDGRDEIMADIEARIAEMLQEKLNEKKQVVSVQEIEEVIAIMGEPEQYLDEDASEQTSAGTGSQAGRKGTKRLYRDPDGNVVGGVCSGIGYYFGFDPIWLRIAFAVAAVFGGSGLLIYIILWVIIPEAKTTAEKLEMQGESVNVSTIGKAVEREMDNVKTKVKAFGQNTGPYRNRAKQGIDKFLDFMINLFTGFFRVFGKLMGGVFIAFSIAVLASFVVGIFFPDEFFLVHAFDQENVDLISWSDFLFPSSEVATLCMVGLTLAVLIPTIGLFYGGLRLLFKLQPGPRAIGPILGGLWFVSIVLLAIGAFQTARDFQVEAETGDVIALDSLTSDTLTLAMGNDVFGNGVVPTFRHRHQRRGRYYGHRDHLARFEGSRLLRGYPIVDVIRGTGDSIRVFVIRTAEGATQKLASGRSKHIDYNYTVSDNRLTLDSYFTIRQRDKWRDQEVEIVVELPVGKSIYLAPGMEYLIWDIDNVTNTWDYDMIDKTWTMTSEGLACVTCDEMTL